LPAQRSAFMLREAGVTVLFGDGDLIGDLPVGRLRTVLVDDPLIDAMPGTAPDLDAPIDRVAYVMFTSGSTGRPKAVQVTHRGLVNYLSGAPGRLGIGAPGASYALLQPPTTDFGNTVLFTALTTGGEVHFLDSVTDPEMVAGYLAEHAIDYLKIVPSHLLGLAEGVGLERLIPGKALVLGGEASPISLARDLVAAAGDRIVANHYGPTETTIGVATVRLSAELLRDVVVPIGEPLPNMRLHVLDRSLRPVPVGVHGELYVGGPGLARGYRGRPELTAERFVAGPGGMRLYRTGDVVRQRPDGLIAFLGRVDDQLKVRGYRIEPAEIQAALTAHPAVNAAVVVADDRQRLVAYVVADDTAGLREFVAARLPEHMIPAFFVELTAIPLTANGKLDRKALPAPEAGSSSAFQAPRDAAEEQLAAIWGEVLGVERVGVHDNFFELGGHSLLAIQVVASIRAAGRELSVGDLFDHPTVAELAPLTGELAEAWRPSSLVELRRGTDEPPLYLVHSGTGGVTDYTAIAGHFAEGQRVVGVQSRGFADEAEPLTTVVEMARAYLEDIRRVQPEGPYLFAGWSMGGYIALEMARQLGEGEVFVVGPPVHPLRRRRIVRLERRSLLRLARAVTRAVERGTVLPARAEALLLRLWNVDEDAVAAVRAGDPAQLRAARVVLLNSAASVQYRQLLARKQISHDGRVVLFVPEGDPRGMRRRTLAQWLAIAPGAEVIDAPGTHFTLVRGEHGPEFAGRRLSAEIQAHRG
jgi:amino acid adenylation domain-containing protein